ncbi:MAG: hypothetical protein DRP18_03570 [Candidatus Aenigmatarchaeota archaeon]|nr:MAG: hypothetical protein DRP18_03570 [Candidatus Aenigmarchaeota archaeon]
MNKKVSESYNRRDTICVFTASVLLSVVFSVILIDPTLQKTYEFLRHGNTEMVTAPIFNFISNTPPLFLVILAIVLILDMCIIYITYQIDKYGF